MVSRRNYVAITAVMVIIFFLFQFLNMAKDHWNDYSENQYAIRSAKHRTYPMGEEKVCRLHWIK